MAGERELLRALTTQLDEAESVDAMMQRLVDGGARLLVSARAGVPLHLQPNFEYRLGQGLLGWIALHGQPIRTGAADEDPRFWRSRAWSSAWARSSGRRSSPTARPSACSAR